jgi:hypothetical protein
MVETKIADQPELKLKDGEGDKLNQKRVKSDARFDVGADGEQSSEAQT